jgi:hypothetical protein
VGRQFFEKLAIDIVSGIVRVDARACPDEIMLLG